MYMETWIFEALCTGVCSRVKITDQLVPGD